MNATGLLGSCSLLFGLIVAQPAPALAQADSDAATADGPLRDGQHDFDFEFGAWRTELRRLLDPLTGSDTWVEYEGTDRKSVV